MMEAQTLEELVPVMRKYAWRRAGRYDRDEFESAAMWGLAVANKSFDPAAGVPFNRWCWMKVAWAIDELVRSHARRNAVALVYPVEATFLHYVEDPRDSLGEWGGIEQAKEMLSVLPPRRRAIVANKVLGGLTNDEIAREQGCTESRISTIVNQSLRKIRHAGEVQVAA